MKHPKIKFVSLDHIKNENVDHYVYYDVGPRTENYVGQSVDDWDEFKTLAKANVRFTENVGSWWRISAGYLKRHNERFGKNVFHFCNNVGKKKLKRLVHKLFGENVTIFDKKDHCYIEFKLTEIGDKFLEEL